MLHQTGTSQFRGITPNMYVYIHSSNHTCDIYACIMSWHCIVMYVAQQHKPTLSISKLLKNIWSTEDNWWWPMGVFGNTLETITGYR